MAAVTLTRNTPTSDALPAAGTRRRVVLPGMPHPALRIWSASEVYVELTDAADGSSSGTADHVIPPGTTVEIPIGRGECAVSASTGSQSVVLTAVERSNDQGNSPRHGPQVITLSGSITDPSAIVNALTQDDDGWITADLDASIGDLPNMDDGAYLEMDLLDTTGRPISVNSTFPYFVLLEVDRLLPALCGCAVIVGGSDFDSTGGDTHIGVRIDGDGSGNQVTFATTSTDDSAKTGYDATTRRGFVQFTANTSAGTIRSRASVALTAGNAFVACDADLTARVNQTDLPKVRVGVMTPGGGAGAASNVFRFRPLVWAMLDPFDPTL